MPGELAGAQVTGQGTLYWGQAELVLRAGPDLAPLRLTRRTLAGGRRPVLRARRSVAGVEHRVEWFAAREGGTPAVFVRLELRNRGARARTARVGVGLRHGGGRTRFLRPAEPPQPGLYTQPGVVFDPRARLVFAGRRVERAGRVLVVLPPARGAVRRTTRAPVRTGTEAALEERRVRLAPGARVALDLRVPLADGPVPGTGHDAARAALLREWRTTLGAAVRLRLPERRVEQAFDAALVQLLGSRHRLPDGRWVQTVNKLQYHAFWLRDAAMAVHALDLAGLHEQAGEDLGFFGAWQRPDGQLISRPGQLDGHGQALWALGEHAVRTGDRAAAAAALPLADRAMAWLRTARAGDPLGLLPPSDPRDNELVAGRLAGDAFWAVAGARGAADLARLAGDDARATAWAGEAEALRAAVRAAAARAAAGARGAIPPALDRPGGRDWGNLWAAWPTGALDARDPLVTATLRATRRTWREGIATWGPSLHGYLGFRVLQTELRRGARRAVVDGLYAHLAHTTATHGGFETGTRPWGRRDVGGNLTPHGWFAAELVALVREALVHDDAGGIALHEALPPAWLRPGRPTDVRGAPTRFGRVDVTLVPRPGGATLRWRAPEGVPLTWRVPLGVRDVRAPGLAPGAARLRLPAARGELRLRWRLAAPEAQPTLARTVRALREDYARRGRAAPRR